MKKKLFTALLAGALIVSLSTAAFAGSSIRMFYNGSEIQSKTAPININGSIFAPVRALAEAMGAEVTWDKDSGQVNITGNDQSAQTAKLERALAPKDSLEAANAWAEAVQTRNGAWQYAVMTPELKKASYDELSSMGWTTGASSPWVKSFAVKEIEKPDEGTYRYAVTFTWTDSTNVTYDSTQYVTVKNAEGSWLVDAIETISVKGEITKVTLGDDKKIKSIFVEGKSAEAVYDEATVLIGADTKIYQGNTNTEMKPEDLKTGTSVEVYFKEGPMIMIYPPQAEAAVIRVF